MLKLNSTEITGSYRVNRIGSDKTSTYNLQTSKPTRYDGEVVISYVRDPKFIDVEIAVMGTDRENVENLVDTLKQIADLHGDPMVISYKGGYRLFYAHISSIDVAYVRNNEFIPWRVMTLHFEIADPPFGLDCDIDGNIITTDAFAQTGITSDVFSAPVAFSGTVKPKPQIQLTYTSVGDMTGFDVTNRKTGQQMTITPSTPTDGDVFVIDTDNLTVQRNGLDQDFTGIFPEFSLDASGNTVDVNTYSSTGTILAASNTTNITKRRLYGTRKEAQSFTISTSDLVNRVNLLLSKTGSGAGAITLRIETNSAGSPSGTLVNADSTITVDSSTIGLIPTWIQNAFNFVPLTLSTTYWLVVSTTGGDVNNCWNWHMSNSSTYANGSAKEYVSAWSALTGDFDFKVFKVAIDINNSTFDYDSVTINLASATQKDAGNTTANWDTANSRVTMNGVATLDQQQVTQKSYNFGPLTVNGDGYGYDFCAQSFTPSVTRPIDSLIVNMYVGDQGLGGSINGYTVYCWLYADSSGVPGSAVASGQSSMASNGLNSIADRTFTFAGRPVLTAGTKYHAVFFTDIPGSSSQPGVYLYGAGSSYYAGGNALFKDSSFGTSNWQTSAAIMADVVDFYFKEYYVDYTATEYGTTNELDSTGADVVAISLTATNSNPGSSTIQHQVSNDNGANWENITKDATIFAADYIPGKSGTQLKWRVALASTDQNKPIVTAPTVGLKKGIILNATGTWAAQSFTVPTTANRQRLDLYLAKLGTPGDITVRIESDTAGHPSGTLVDANATKTLTQAAVSSAFGWVSFNFPVSFSLSTATTYWIVAKAAATVNDANKYLIMANNNRLGTGTSSKTTNSGSAWTNTSSSEDLMFKTYATTGNVFRYDLSVTYTIRYE